MAHVMKSTKAACGHLFAHYERAKGEDGSYINFGNQDIDRSRTHLNYNLATHQLMRQGDFVRARCSEVHCHNRKDVNVMASWVITAPQDLPAHETRRFFEESYAFLQSRYGKENVVSAYVHMDEVTPHMHFAFVPVAYDAKKQCFKVSAKDRINRHDLQTFHNDLSGHLERSLGHPVGILNEATVEGNKSIEELKRGTAQKKLQTVKKECEEVQNAITKARTELFDLMNSKIDLNGEIELLMIEREKILAEAEQKAQKRILEAQKEATGITATAKVGAAGILQKAEKDAAEIRAAATPAQIRKLQDENDVLKRVVVQLKERCATAEESNQLYEAVIESSPELEGMYRQAHHSFIRNGGTIQKPGR